MGPVILDLIGTELSQEERELLQHPSVGGVILFARNYVTTTELIQLCHAIRQSRSTPLLIAVDQEGGRVQRFRDRFTRIPSMGQIGKMYDHSPLVALKTAETCGWIMASELLATGIDLSFAPVLDLNKELNLVIGDRAFHSKPSNVIALAKSVMYGMHAAGMAATGKHFPGHGSVTVDSHLELPVDMRNINEMATEDLQPFIELIWAGLNAIMPAHIIFPKIDNNPVGFSPYWLQKILRKQYHFSGMIFSDDLNMSGAAISGDYSDRASAALEAGCDMILICNNRTAAVNILDRLPQKYFLDNNKFKIMQGKFSVSFESLLMSKEWQEKHTFIMRQTECFQKVI